MQYCYVRVLQDNYVWIIYNEHQEAIVVDCGDAQPVLDFLDQHNLTLLDILITHGHFDHINGISVLAKETKAKVSGHPSIQPLLRDIDLIAITAGELSLLNNKLTLVVMPTPGHCQDHLAYFMPEIGLCCVGDLLFCMGCGRVLDGTIEQLWSSIQRINTLPKDTVLLYGHDYTKQNIVFGEQFGVMEYSKINELLTQNKIPPTTLELERKYNLFLNTDNKQLKKQILGDANQPDFECFAKLRILKDNN